jgi:hypothetical protein
MSFSNILSIIFSGVVTVATVVYVILTRQLAAETRAMRRVASEPLVSVYLEISKRLGISWSS